MKVENNQPVKIGIRKAIRLDVPQIFELIKELALFEKAPHEVTNTPEQLLKDGFGENPLYGCYVALANEKVVGMALYYFRYSTWKGKRLYLEDIIVNEKYRGKQIGRHLMDAVLDESIKTNCSGILWQVLDWNEPAIQFYKKYNPAFDNEWINVAMSKDEVNLYLSKL